MYIIYLFVVLSASIIGAISGVGGGVMIKPIFDAISPYNTYTVGMLSCFGVLTMSLTSVARQIANKTRIQFRTAIPLALGAIAGGLLGNFIFNYIRQSIDDSVIKITQAVILASLLIFVTIYMNKSGTADRKPIICGSAMTVLTGLLLGMVSTFIGIGGGPITIAVLCLLFALDMKAATVNSLVLILFSQTSKLIENIVTGRIFAANLPWGLILGVCLAASIGGLIGTKLNRKLTSKKILLVYTVTMIAIIGINIYNVITNLLLLLS